MDRTEFLNLCKKVSILLPHIPELSFKKGATVHIAILHDLKANSVMRCMLDAVKLKNTGQI